MYDVNTGRVYAPVSVADVRSALGANSLDVATLCTHTDINPHSLIRPFYTTVPYSTPDALLSANGLGPQPPNSNTCEYVPKKWGYFVPRLLGTNIANVLNIKDEVWKRAEPTADSFKCLLHFDGYLAGAAPVNPVTAYIVEGHAIAVNFNLGLENKDVIASDGNHGGVVSIPNVLGTENIRIGCSLWENGQHKGNYMNTTPIGQAPRPEENDPDQVPEMMPVYLTINTGVTAQSGKTYLVVPWVTDAAMSNNQLPAGANIYNVRFSDRFDPNIEVTLLTRTVSISAASYDKSNTAAKKIKFTITFTSSYDTSQVISGLGIEYTTTKSSYLNKLSLTDASGAAGTVTVPANNSLTIEAFSADTALWEARDILNRLVLKASHGATVIRQEMKVNNATGGTGSLVGGTGSLSGESTINP